MNSNAAFLPQTSDLSVKWDPRDFTDGRTGGGSDSDAAFLTAESRVVLPLRKGISFTDELKELEWTEDERDTQAIFSPISLITQK